MGGVGIRRVGQVQGTEFIMALPPFRLRVKQRIGGALRHHAVPGCGIVHILPEVKAVVAELVVILVSVKKSVAIVRAQLQGLYIFHQQGVCLGGGKGIDPVLLRHLGPHELCVLIGLRGPV